MVKNTQRRRLNVRQRQKSNPQPTPNVNVVSATHGTDQVTIVFSAPIQIAPGNLPASWTFGATPRTVTSLVSNSGNTVVLGLSGTVAMSDPYTMAANDPAARTSGGGFVNAKSGTLS